MEANFTTNVKTGLIPLTVAFTDTSLPPGDSTAWEWDFGDGSPVSTLRDPVHTYTTIPALPATEYTVTLTVTINSDIYYHSGKIKPVSTPVGQRVKVQGNSVRWQASDRDMALRFDLNGELHVGGKSGLPANITTNPGSVDPRLNIWSSSDVSIYAGLTSASPAKLKLNGVAWPPTPGDINPQQGEYVGIGPDGASTLAYLKFFPYEASSDTLTEEELNESYPGLMPGQQVLAPNTIYVCVKIEDGVRKWRRILAP